MAEKGNNSSAQGGEEVYNDGQYSGPGILVGRAGRSVIMPDQPLPDYNSPSALAYHCVSRVDNNRTLMAMVCAPNFPARYDVLNHMRGNISGVVRVADWGFAQFPGEATPRLIIVVDRPGGPRVMENLTSKFTPISEEYLLNFFLMPTLVSLKEMGARNVSHRGIRPTNLFYSDPSRRMMMLGDCVTSPPAYDQPDSYETIESAMCSPIGRGSGGVAEDLYSLGVTLLTLLLGYDPVGERSQQILLEQKVEMGSYTALVGQARVPIGVMEALRGLLNDNVRERWTLNDLEMWIDGRRLSPRQPKMPMHSARPFNFMGRDYMTARGLGMAFSRNFDQAPTAIRMKIMDGWVRRSLGDELRANAVQSALSATINNATGRNSEDRLVARVCIALDPEAPIRFRGFGVNIDGLAYALSASTENAELRRILAEIIHARLAGVWVGLQERPSAEALRLAQSLDRMPQIIDNAQPGFGLERVLYELSQAEPCHSPLLTGYFVWDANGVIPALEAVAKKPNRPNLTIDRHFAAFIAARMRRYNEEVIRIVLSSDPETRSLAILKLLAGVQDQMNGNPAPNLSQWLLSSIEHVAAGYRQPLRRERISARLKRAATTGYLRDMVNVVDDVNERNADELEFRSATEEFAQLKIAISEHDLSAKERHQHAIEFGEQVAAAIGGVLVSVTMAVTIFVWLF